MLCKCMDITAFLLLSLFLSWSYICLLKNNKRIKEDRRLYSIQGCLYAENQQCANDFDTILLLNVCPQSWYLICQTTVNIKNRT